MVSRNPDDASTDFWDHRTKTKSTERRVVAAIDIGWGVVPAINIGRGMAAAATWT